MVKIKRKLQLSAAFAALILVALAVGCSGFFVDPTLTTITVTPATPSLVAGNTLQMIATGTYDDGSTKNVSGTATWTTSDSSVATISSTGLLAGVATGTATITATSGAITGTTTATIQVAGLQSITLTPSAGWQHSRHNQLGNLDLVKHRCCYHRCKWAGHSEIGDGSLGDNHHCNLRNSFCEHDLDGEPVVVFRARHLCLKFDASLSPPEAGMHPASML